MAKEYPRIDITVDAVVFGYKPDEGISVLLIKRKKDPFKGTWAIPGGFVEVDESLEHAVSRELKEETGIEVNYLEQLYTFGEPKRDPRKRIVSVAYYALVKPDIYEVHAADDAEGAEWFNIEKLPKLAFDHKYILEMAIFRLRNKISYEPVGFELLDKHFPFSELHKLYETLYGKEIDRRNFKKKFLSLGILKELKEKNSGGKGRPGLLYQFDKDKYFQLKKKGIVFEI
ncbi:MAG: hydrolase [Bacteroidetes bacterium]|jgi:8-oxo-dGTP diphosphatase|nr:hydrolase [Bacteroidota bacterium]